MAVVQGHGHGTDKVGNGTRGLGIGKRGGKEFSSLEKKRRRESGVGRQGKGASCW